MYSIYSQTAFLCAEQKGEKEKKGRDRKGEMRSLVSLSVTRNGNCVRRE